MPKWMAKPMLTRVNHQFSPIHRPYYNYDKTNQHRCREAV
jgi:hypothetical protein